MDPCQHALRPFSGSSRQVFDEQKARRNSKTDARREPDRADADSETYPCNAPPLSGGRSTLDREAIIDVPQRHFSRRHGSWKNVAGNRGPHSILSKKEKSPFDRRLSHFASLQLEGRSSPFQSRA